MYRQVLSNYSKSAKVLVQVLVLLIPSIPLAGARYCLARHRIRGCAAFQVPSPALLLLQSYQRRKPCVLALQRIFCLLTPSLLCIHVLLLRALHYIATRPSTCTHSSFSAAIPSIHIYYFPHPNTPFFPLHTYIHSIPPPNKEESHFSPTPHRSSSFFFSLYIFLAAVPTRPFPRCNRLLRPLYLQRSCSNPSESRYPNRRSRQHSAPSSSSVRMPAGQRLPSVCVSSTTTTPTIASRLS